MVRLDHLCKAQFGEDRILWRIFQGRTEGYFVEVGSYDGVTLSNTFLLEQLGWSGVLIEPIRSMCDKAAAVRKRSRVIHAAAGRRGSPPIAAFTIAQNVPVLSFLTADESHKERCRREGAQLVEVQVPVVTLDAVLRHDRDHAPPGCGPWQTRRGWCIDLISIDVEGGELDVLDGLSLDRFNPRVLLIENDRPSGNELEPYLNERGYRRFYRRKINDFYVRIDDPADDLRLEGLDPNDAGSA